MLAVGGEWEPLSDDLLERLPDADGCAVWLLRVPSGIPLVFPVQLHIDMLPGADRVADRAPRFAEGKVTR